MSYSNRQQKISLLPCTRNKNKTHNKVIYTWMQKAQLSDANIVSVSQKNVFIFFSLYFTNFCYKTYRYHFIPFPNKSWFLRFCSTSLLKMLWEKKKLPVTSNFSFFPQCLLALWRTFCHFRQI